jgi:hypothetical protein
MLSVVILSVVMNVVILSDVTLNVTHTPFQLSVTLNDVMLSVVVLSVFILSVFILSVVSISIVMLSVVMVSVAAPLKVVRNKISTFFVPRSESPPISQPFYKTFCHDKLECLTAKNISTRVQYLQVRPSVFKPQWSTFG